MSIILTKSVIKNYIIPEIWKVIEKEYENMEIHDGDKLNISLGLPHDGLKKYIEEENIINNNCPDCTDGFYYPFSGKPEKCKTCQ